MHYTDRWAVLSAALVFGVACILSGCGPPGDGTGARAVGRYVSREYGKAKLIQVSSRTSSWGGFDAFAWMEEQANREIVEAEALKDLESGGKDTGAEDLEKKYSAGDKRIRGQCDGSVETGDPGGLMPPWDPLKNR